MTEADAHQTVDAADRDAAWPLQHVLDQDFQVTELALSSRSPAGRGAPWLLRYFLGLSALPNATPRPSTCGATLKKGRSPIARSDSLFLVRRPRGAA